MTDHVVGGVLHHGGEAVHLDKQNAVIDAVRQYLKDDDINKAFSDLTSKVYGGQEVKPVQITALKKQFIENVLLSYNSAPLTALIYAQTIDEQVALIKLFAKTMKPDEINRIGQILTNSGSISIKTWNMGLRAAGLIK